jgi:3-oxoacyl-[acyl-carrier protein] reductase
MNIDLTGKTALVTGAAGELGRVMARTLAICGADVIIHYHTKKQTADKLSDEIKAMGRKTLVVQADITDSGSISKMKDIASKEIGLPDIVVNNAVIQYKWETILEQSAEDYQKQFDSCVMQNVLMAKAFIPDMMIKGKGRFIAISTECAMQNLPTQSAYVAGKRGMDGVLRVLAREVGQYQITVNQVAPGWTISDRDRLNNTEHREEYENSIPLRRRGTDQEVANAVAFLASDLAGYITGAFIPVCGGNVMPTI